MRQLRVVVADATPLRYLILIGEIDLLNKLYGEITVPSAVVDELSVTKIPALVRAWVAAFPPWVRTLPAVSQASLSFPELGLGEREAIAVARETSTSILLTDDLRARAAAESLGIQVVPTIRILSTAGVLSLVDFDDAIVRLRQTNFRVSDRIIARIRKRQSKKS